MVYSYSGRVRAEFYLFSRQSFLRSSLIQREMSSGRRTGCQLSRVAAAAAAAAVAIASTAATSVVRCVPSSPLATYASMSFSSSLLLLQQHQQQ